MNLVRKGKNSLIMKETGDAPSNSYGAIQKLEQMDETETIDNTTAPPTVCDVPADTPFLSSPFHKIRIAASMAISEPISSPTAEDLFRYLLLVQVFMYLEAGAVPALLESFTITFVLTPQEQGLLGAIVYIAISLASPFCSTLFEKFSPRNVLAWTLVLNILAVGLFALTPSKEDASYATFMLIISRACIGCSQAFHCVYSPLWVHDYAPRSKRARWMSYLQAAVPIGITLGYLAGSVTVWTSPDVGTSDEIVLKNSQLRANQVCSGILCWRWPFLFQALVLIPFSVLLFFVPEDNVKLKNPRRKPILVLDSMLSEEEQGEENSSSDECDKACEEDLDNHIWKDCMELLQLRVYVCIVLALSALFFVVTGVQFWTTLYLSTNTSDSMYSIHLSYLVVSGTGPILGVFFGGWCIDQCGGYAGATQEAIALQVCVVFGALACAASLPVSFIHNTLYIAFFLWTMLFFGASILPACSGIVISSAPNRLRPLASSVAYTSYNLLGYAASNYVPGLIMNLILKQQSVEVTESTLGATLNKAHVGCDRACTYRIGFRIVLFWGLWALLCLGAAFIISKRNAAMSVTTLKDEK